MQPLSKMALAARSPRPLPYPKYQLNIGQYCSPSTQHPLPCLRDLEYLLHIGRMEQPLDNFQVWKLVRIVQILPDFEKDEALL